MVLFYSHQSSLRACTQEHSPTPPPQPKHKDSWTRLPLSSIVAVTFNSYCSENSVWNSFLQRPEKHPEIFIGNVWVQQWYADSKEGAMLLFWQGQSSLIYISYTSTTQNSHVHTEKCFWDYLINLNKLKNLSCSDKEKMCVSEITFRFQGQGVFPSLSFYCSCSSSVIFMEQLPGQRESIRLAYLGFHRD